MTVFHTQTLPPDRREGKRGGRKPKGEDRMGRGKARGSEGGGKKKEDGQTRSG